MNIFITHIYNTSLGDSFFQFLKKKKKPSFNYSFPILPFQNQSSTETGGAWLGGASKNMLIC